MSNRRGYGFSIRGARDDPAGSPIKFVASSEVLARDGKSLKMANFDLTNFRANPVFLWAHDYAGRPPIGRVDWVDVVGDTLQARVVFDQGDPFAREVERKYRENFIRAVSIGWNDVQKGKRTYHDLLDLSSVPIGSDPTALLTERQVRSLQPYGVDLSTSKRFNALAARVQAGVVEEFVNRGWLSEQDAIDELNRIKQQLG